MNNIFNYIDRPSVIHNLTGATKFICLVAWSFAAMSTYDTRLLLAMTLFSFILLKVAKIKWKDISFLMGFTFVFMVINNIMLYVFAPQHGTTIYGTCTYLLNWQHYYSPTAEELFYILNYFLKYSSTIPFVLLFVCTTNPSEFAASLNKIGVKYSVAYAVALALRYIPDVQREYDEISKASQARGVEMSKKAGVIARIKSACAILIPLILSSMNKIEIIANAMELRCFGKNKKRTWYMGRDFKLADYLAMLVCIIMIAIAFWLNHINGGRFYNPFI